MFIRYELYVEDEPQDVGIFRGLDELGLSDDFVKGLMWQFDRNLKVPKPVRHTQSWFTQAGEEMFRQDIDKVIAVYEEDGFFEVRRIEKEYLEDIVYEDEYQVLIKEDKT